MPTSLPPLSYQGWAISSQVSCTTLLGGGRAAPGREPSICHTSTSRPMTSSGGSTWVTKPCAALPARTRSGPGAGGAWVTRGMASVLCIAYSSGRLDVLDGQAVEVFLRVGRIENLAVEEF